jgi:hypothetical protein
LLVEIDDWEGNFHVGVASPAMPADERHQGLFYSRGFELDGRILAPGGLLGERLRASSLLIRPDVNLARRADVGRLYDLRGDRERNCLAASLILPADGLLPALTGLASRWRYLHIWVQHGAEPEKGITDFSFSRAIPPQLQQAMRNG